MDGAEVGEKNSTHCRRRQQDFRPALERGGFGFGALPGEQLGQTNNGRVLIGVEVERMAEDVDRLRRTSIRFEENAYAGGKIRIGRALKDEGQWSIPVN